MLAAARTQGRVAYVLEPRFAALEAELTAGNPVLVLQDLGALGLRLWHFAVVIGYDPATRGGHPPVGHASAGNSSGAPGFQQTWQAGGNWAAVITPAGPARPPRRRAATTSAPSSAAAPHLAPGRRRQGRSGRPCPLAG